MDKGRGTSAVTDENRGAQWGVGETVPAVVSQVPVTRWWGAENGGLVPPGFLCSPSRSSGPESRFCHQQNLNDHSFSVYLTLIIASSSKLNR